MSDLISRQAAIDALEESEARYFDRRAIIGKMQDIINGLPSAQPERTGRWIPCSERMPEAGSWAIWCSNKGIIQVARWKTDLRNHFFPDQGFFELEDAVAWMPMPEPYMEVEHEHSD